MERGRGREFLFSDSPGFFSGFSFFARPPSRYPLFSSFLSLKRISSITAAVKALKNLFSFGRNKNDDDDE